MPHNFPVAKAAISILSASLVMVLSAAPAGAAPAIVVSTVPSPGGTLKSVTCPTTEWCAAIGRSTLFEGSGGDWTGTVAPVPSDAGTVVSESVLSVSCAAVNACVAVGFYGSNIDHGAIFTLSGGTWTAITAPLPPGVSLSTAEGNEGGVLSSVSCPVVGSCESVGYYTDELGHTQGWLLAQSGDTWSATQAAVPLGANVDPDELMGEIVCPGEGSCAAIGSYEDPNT
ncbi:MAG: hypothetical protein ACRD6W_01160, partial [Nitrososphaerales archaeon]